MGLFKRLAGFLGLAKDEEQQQNDDVSPDGGNNNPFASTSAQIPAQHLPRKGFSVPVQVPVERGPPPPLLQFCPAGDGGLQGLRWYARRLRIDDDGDIADEFLDEVVQDASASVEEHNRSLPGFQMNYRTKPAKVINQALLPNGRTQQQVVYQGQLEWV